MPDDAKRYLPHVLAGIVVLTVASTLGAAFAPALLEYSPLGLLGLSPTIRHLVLVATLTPVVPFVLIAVIRRALSAGTSYGLGYIYRERMLDWMKGKAPRYAGVIDAVQCSFRRFGPLLLFVFPGITSAALAGIAGMRLRAFLPLMLAGQAAWMTAIYYVGDALRAPLTPVITWITAHMLEATLVSIVIVAAYEVYRRRRGQSAVPDFVD